MRNKKFRVYPWKQGSASAKMLAEALEGKVLKHANSKYRPRGGDVVINWGSSDVPPMGPATTLNADVVDAHCKLKTFQRLEEGAVPTPKWTRDRNEAEDLGFPVVCRTKLRGHSGEGIVIANNKDELVPAPLYVQYVKKKDEYRVHVLKDDAFFVQRKARKLDVEEPNWQIRNLVGGFVFVEAEPDGVPGAVLDVARASVAALGLDFAGVDVIWNDKEQKAYVLELNTACGLEARTAANYREAIVRLFAN